MTRPLPLAACYHYTPTDFDPGYKFLLASVGQSGGCFLPINQFYPGDEYLANDNACIRLAFRGLEVKRDGTFKLMFGWGTTESFNRAISLVGQKLLEELQACYLNDSSYIEWDDKYLYDLYTDIPYIQPLTSGRFTLQGINADCVKALLEADAKVRVIELSGRYCSLEHVPRYREVSEVRRCLN